VSPRGIAIAEVEQAASGLHRITKDRARRQQLTPMLKGGPPCFTLFLNFWKANENSQPQPEKTRMASMPLLSISHTSKPCTTNVEGPHSGVIGCARTFSLCTLMYYVIVS